MAEAAAERHAEGLLEEAAELGQLHMQRRRGIGLVHAFMYHSGRSRRLAAHA